MARLPQIPQWVAKSIDLTRWGVPSDYVQVLEKDLGSGKYWHCWNKVLNKAATVVDDTQYKLYTVETKVLIVSDDFDPETMAF